MAQQTCNALLSWHDDVIVMATCGGRKISEAKGLAAERDAVVQLVIAVRDRTAMVRNTIAAIGTAYQQVPGVMSVEGALVKEFDRADAVLDGAVVAGQANTDTLARFNEAKSKIAHTVSTAGGGGIRLADLHITDAVGTAAVIKTLEAQLSCVPIFG